MRVVRDVTPRVDHHCLSEDPMRSRITTAMVDVEVGAAGMQQRSSAPPDCWFPTATGHHSDWP